MLLFLIVILFASLLNVNYNTLPKFITGDDLKHNVSAQLKHATAANYQAQGNFTHAANKSSTTNASLTNTETEITQTPWWTEPGSLLGIAGIIATAIVGFTIFIMQKRANSKINRIIERGFSDREERKKFWVNGAIHELEEIRKLNNNAFEYLKNYHTGHRDSIFIEKMRRFFLMGDYSFRVNYIPFMHEAGLRLMDLIDTKTALDMRNWIDSLSGPYQGMAEAYNLGKPLGSLNSTLDAQSIISILKSHNETVQDLLDRLQKEI
jgi:hypothetical protein